MKNSTKFVLTAGIFSSLAVLSMHIYNKVIDVSSTVKNLVRGDSKNVFSWKLGDIHYSVSGSGSPVLLLHDLHPCFSSMEWNSVINDLSTCHTVYAVDLLGCGCSSRPKITYTNYVYVQLISDFISSIIKEKTDVVTSGISGSIAVMTAKNNSSLIDKIIMINPHDLAELNKIPTVVTRLYKKLLELPIIGSFVYNLEMSQENIDSLFMNELLHDSSYQNQELVDSFYESCHLDNGAGKFLYASLKGKFLNLNITHCIKELPNSIYIIMGEKIKHSYEIVVLYKAINKNINYEIFPHTNHLPHIEAPRSLALKLLTILDN